MKVISTLSSSSEVLPSSFGLKNLYAATSSVSTLNVAAFFFLFWNTSTVPTSAVAPFNAFTTYFLTDSVLLAPKVNRSVALESSAAVYVKATPASLSVSFSTSAKSFSVKLFRLVPVMEISTLPPFPSTGITPSIFSILVISGFFTSAVFPATVN